MLHDGRLMSQARMRRVLDDQYGCAWAFQLPHDDGFAHALHESAIPHRQDVDERAWFVPEADAPAMLELVEKFVGRPIWDDMILRDWEGIGIPEETDYEIARATRDDFRLLGVTRSASFDECRKAYRDRVELNRAGRLSARDLDRAREAFERIQRYET